MKAKAWSLPLAWMAGCTVLSFFAVLVLRDPAGSFLYDAGNYWNGSQLIAGDPAAVELGLLQTRGVLTPFVYLPVALVVAHTGWSATACVFAFNALVVAVLGGVLLPLLLSRMATIGGAHVAVIAAVTTVSLSGFAPVPLMDLVAATIAVVAVILVSVRRWWSLLLAGLALGVAANLRPAYLLSAVLLILLAMVLHRHRGLLVALGALVPVTHQMAFGLGRSSRLAMLPPQVEDISKIQVQYAAYGIRYDTFVDGLRDPRQWYCDPDMARVAAGGLPRDNGDLAGLFISNLPDAAVLSLQKLAAVLQWSWSTPYAGGVEESLRPLGVLVTVLTVLGSVLLVATLRSPARFGPVPVALLLLFAGSAITIVASAPEARFGLPMVLVGLVGVGMLPSLITVDRRRAVMAVGVGALLAVGTLAVGASALSSPLPPGDVTAASCVEHAKTSR